MNADLDELAGRHVILFGGKGGVGKTTIAVHAALHYVQTRRVILFTTDPASSLGDVVSSSDNLTIESLDADALYARFLSTHLDPILEIADRGTYLDREELRRFFELSLPGIDELMAWMHIGELAEENAEAMIVVDTAPTGHTLRMLSSSEHFQQLALALDAMQEKHRAMVRQFTRRSDVRDAMDAFIEDLDARARSRRELLTDATRTAFIPVFLSEPWVVEQTVRLIAEVSAMHVPFAVLNRAVLDPDCALDDLRMQRDAEARTRVNVRVVDFARSCTPLAPLRGERVAEGRVRGALARTTFFAGKGGVGKTTCSASTALQLATTNPHRNYTIISVDPAHSLRDVFATEQPPKNLAVEIIDTKAKWQRFRATLGREIDNAIDALTPRGLTVDYDAEAMRQLLEIAPPGADELFAITRLADLVADESLAGIIVDTAPTGHFLRLLDLPKEAGEWVREFMRLLLRYKDLIPAGSLGEELVRASRALKDLDAVLHSDAACVVVVTRPEPIVLAETSRLLQQLDERGLSVGAVIANYVTPRNECNCDQTMRAHELAALDSLGANIIIERRDAPVTRLDELASLVPLP